ncbi:hypothetical protein [Enterococcus sp. AZ163]|uniref:hypothetical protein n=1 Tax=Enterococcus sp. AZ163 TaxID=2774638 RepID=UPI003D275F6E
MKKEIDKQMDIGTGEVQLLTNEISPENNIIGFMVTDFDEEKTTFVYVANQQVLADSLKNNQEYSIGIERLEDAHSTDYKSKVQFYQTEDDTENNENVTLFKQVRCTVK